MTPFRGRKGGKSHPITPRKGSLYQEAENESLAREVHAGSREDAQASADQLMADFHRAKTPAHRKEIWRATSEEATRLEVDSRNFRNSAAARSRMADESRIFRAKADEMRAELRSEGAFERR